MTPLLPPTKPLAVLAGILFAVATATAAVAAERPDLVLADFEGADFGAWKVTGTAFGTGPKEGVASSASKERNAYGTLTSPPFTIERRYLNFRLGGDVRGNHIRLVVEGKNVFTAAGLTSGRRLPWSWDLQPYLGKTATIEIRDFKQERSGVFAHIEVDDIALSEHSALATLERTVLIEQPYLNLPAARIGRPATFTLEIDGKLFRQGWTLPPGGSKPDYWLSMHLPQFVGKSATLRMKDAPRDSAALTLFHTTAQPHGAETLYGERLRPQFHFSPRNGWLNDPNGMVYHDGRYHLFYQHNALGLAIGNQSWGHAVSRDLFHWEEWPVVLEPFSFSKGRSYSGSAVIDRQGRAGFGKNALIAAYTGTGGGAPAHGPEAENQRAEVIAASNDEGRTFTYAESNPIFRHPERPGGRDPKIIWWPRSDVEQTDPRGHWVMVVYSTHHGAPAARLLTSPDLKTWTQTDVVPDHYECVEFFELPLLAADGQPTGRTKWVLQGGNGTYHVGDFDGQRFTGYEPQKQQTLYRHGYAFQCFNHAPDGRVIAMAWIGRHTDWGEMPFSQMMGLPVELTLRDTPAGPRVRVQPPREFEALRREVVKKENFPVLPDAPVKLPVKGQQLDVTVTFKPAPRSTFTIQFGGDHIVWSDGKFDKRLDLAPDAEGCVTLRIVMDRTLLEVFGGDGVFYVPLPRKEQGREVGVRLTGRAEVRSCIVADIARTMGK